MGILHRHKLVETIVDPSSKALSMSRVCLPIMVLADIGWVIACVIGIPPANAIQPVSSMLGVCTGAVAGVYGVNSLGGAWNRGCGSSIMSNAGAIAQQASNEVEQTLQKAKKV